MFPGQNKDCPLRQQWKNGLPVYTGMCPLLWMLSRGLTAAVGYAVSSARQRVRIRQDGGYVRIRRLLLAAGVKSRAFFPSGGK